MMRIQRFKDQSGGAMVVVMALLLMTTLAALSMFSISDDDISIATNTQNSTRAFYAAEAGLAIARAQLWSDYIDWASTKPYKTGGEVGTRQTYIAFIEEKGLTDSASVNIVSSMPLGNDHYVDSVRVDRLDLGGSTVLTVTSTGRASDNSHHVIQTVWQIQGEAFKGFEFAILSNNVNCIMCHARIDNVDRVFNTDPGLDGSFDRVKIASLESMLLRADKADSYVAGTVYTRGIVTDKQGNPITDLSPSGTGLEGYAINSSDGKIQEPLSSVSLVNTTGSPLPQNGNLYMNYPTDEADMTDGNLPETFPPPFPDDNSNRMVDDDEYAQLAGNSSGSISGGVIYGVPSGGSYASSTLPGAGNETGVSQSYNGNLILVGTDANPIVINGDVAIDGDVIIQGKVKGTGQIFARGNVYVTGDLTYADSMDGGNRMYGTASDGGRNALSLAAGKNILVGDYLTPKKGDIMDNTVVDPGNQSGGESFSFAMSEMTLFNRAEWTKTQPFLPDQNNNLVANATYDPTHTPRYYTMNEGDPVYIFNKPFIEKGKMKGTYWDAATNSWKGKEHVSAYELDKLTKIDAGDPLLTGASVISLQSSNSWITPQTLKDLWIDDENNRASGDKFKIDGQLYTNNSIFTLTRKASKTGGKMEVNGALVAADVGVLVGGGLNLNYDQRLKSFLKIKDDSKVAMAQLAWYSQ